MEMIDSSEVARRLGVSRKAVTELARKGQLPCVRISRKLIRFDWKAIAEKIGLPPGWGAPEKERSKE